MSNDMDVLKSSVEEIEKGYSYWSDNNNKFRRNLDFTLGFQWEDQSASYLRRKNETRLTFNKLYPYIKSIMGEQLQNTPDITVRAASKDVEQWEVNLQEGIMRGIFYDSDMPQKTYYVFFNQLCGGFGAYRICTDYDNPLSFDQNLRIEQEDDPTLCYWDINAKDKHKITGNYAGRFLAIPKKDFNDEYPDERSAQGFALRDLPLGKNFFVAKDDYVVIAEHWRKEWKKATIIQLDDGTTMTKDEYEPYLQKLNDEYAKKYYISSINGQALPAQEPPPRIVKTKRDRIYKIKYYKLIPGKILEEQDWPSDYLPLVYVDGDSNMRRGKQEIKSFCQFAHDAQRFYNYVQSQISQQMKNFRREQWIGEPESVSGKGIEEMWKNPEEQAGILLAKRDSAGQLPQKMPPSMISPDLLNAKQFLAIDIQDILGRHESSQGMQGNEISGVAVFNRVVQDNLGSYLQINNLCSAIVACATICLDMIPKIYDSERDIITRDKKGEPSVSTINKFVGQQLNDDGTYTADQVYYENQISNKKYRVELAAGPMFSAQKQIEYNKLVQLASLMPQELVPAMLDLLAENTDLPNTNQLVKRLRAMMPKKILAESGELNEQEMMEFQQEQQKQAQQPPNPALQIEQQKVANEQLNLQLKTQELAQKQQNDARDQQIEVLKTQVELEKINNSRNTENIGLQKDIIKAQTELKTSSLNALHKLASLSKTQQAAGERDASHGNYV